MDIIWLGVIAKKGYQDTVQKIQGDKLQLRLWSAILVYPLMVWGISKFVLQNDSIKKEDKWKAGAILGLLVYGVYNGTNHAILKDWSLETSIKDTLWGVFAFGTVSWVGSRYAFA